MSLTDEKVPKIVVLDNSKTKKLITKIVILEILIDIALVIFVALCAYHASAYDSEGGLTENETYSVIFNPDYAYDSSLSNPVWYKPITDFLYKFNAYFTDNAPSVETTILVKKMTWNINNNQYEDTTHTWSNSYFYYFSDNGTEVPQSSLDPVKEYFKNNTNDIDDFTTVDQNSEHPDILNVTINVDSDGTILDRSAQGYIAMTDDDLSDMKNSIAHQDYGFDLSGMGGEGGLGDIYSSVSTGGSRSAGMSNTFKYLFYGLIPLLFVLSIVNMINKML